MAIQNILEAYRTGRRVEHEEDGSTGYIVGTALKQERWRNKTMMFLEVSVKWDTNGRTIPYPHYVLNIIASKKGKQN